MWRVVPLSYDVLLNNVWSSLALYIFCVLEKGGRNNWVFFQCTLQGMNKETWMLIKGNKKTSLKRGLDIHTAEVVATEKTFSDQHSSSASSRWCAFKNSIEILQLEPKSLMTFYLVIVINMLPPLWLHYKKSSQVMECWRQRKREVSL